jgi:chromosome segregation ATPase
LEKFAQLQVEEHLIEKEAGELEGKVRELKKKKSDAKKILDEIIKNS